MKPKTELLLYQLAWRFDQVLRPGIMNLNRDFETFAYQNGELDRIHELEALGFLERNPEKDAKGGCLQLSACALKRPLYKRHPPSAWKRKWSGTWVQVLFDLHAEDSTARKTLHRALRSQGFGWIQGSVWVHPFLDKSIQQEAKRIIGRPSDILILYSRSEGKKTDRWIVEDAWDWDEIEKRYSEYLLHIQSPPLHSSTNQQLQWVRQERRAWQRIMEVDPLLPKPLLPHPYSGPEVWKHRKLCLAQMDANLNLS